MSGVIFILLGALLGGAALVAGILLLVLKLLAAGSGWNRLAARYGVEGPAPGLPLTRGMTVVVGSVCYRRSMTVGVWSRGLYLSAATVRPPLLIPWGEFTGAVPGKYSMQQVMRLSVGTPPAGTVAVFPELYAAIYPYLDSRVVA